MKQLKPTLFLALLLAFGARGYAQPGSSKKILFVGNSYTYFWNLPQTVALMAEHAGLEWATRQSTVGGADWGHHWRGERELKTINKIEEGDFDVIVIQNHSMSAIEQPDSLMYYGQLLGELIKSKEALPYVYMTWAREWDPYMQKPIEEKYMELAEKIGARIVPVGLAWQRARELRPNLALYDEDAHHPSTIGTYLTGCVFFGVLADRSPVGLPHRLITEDKDGEKLYINIQSKENALFCQKVAEDVVSGLTD